MKVHFTLEEMKNLLEKARADERERCKAAMRKVVELNVQWTFTDLLNAIDIAEAIKAE